MGTFSMFRNRKLSITFGTRTVKTTAIKKFDIPVYYRSSITGRIKESRRKSDPRKQDFSPVELDFGPVKIYIARHFGFCYGVENAIEISYKTIEENVGKRIFLLSQMIHNPEVNGDLQNRGVKFIMDTDGRQFIPWNEIDHDDIVIIPAFGTTLEIEHLLLDKGVEVQKYNTTCPFVEKVWNRSEKLGMENYSVIIHGKQNHEETRATFSHSAKKAPSIIVRDIADAKTLGEYVLGKKSKEEFYAEFKQRHSEGFDPIRDLVRVGVVNQTTMLATETQAIADYFRQLMIQRYGIDTIKEHFADTRDTLCYASNDNQDSTYKLLETDAHFALVVGGYNSSNTTHIVELCEEKFPAYFINSEREILSDQQITHFNIHTKKVVTTEKYIPSDRPVKIVLTSGASCPDTLLDRVMIRMLEFFPGARPLETIIEALY